MTGKNNSLDINRTELLKLHRAVESSDEAIFITDLEGIITYVNPGFTALYGFTSEEVVGLCTPRILKSGVMSPEKYEYFWKTLLGKKFVKGELVNKTKNGKLITVTGSANPILDDNDEIIGFIGVQYDITEQKRVEDSLRQSEELFRKSLMTSPDAVNINRLPDGMYISVNEGFTNILGYTQEDVIGKTSVELNIWDSNENREKVVAELNNHGKLKNFEAEFKSKEGKTVIGLMSASVINLDGVPHILSITKDITDRKKILEAYANEQYLVNALLDTLPDHIYFKDLNSRFIRNSKSHALSFGFEDPNQLKGKTDFDFFDNEGARKAYEDEQRIIKTGQVISKEEKFTRNDNTDVWFTAMKLPLRDKKGNIVGTFGISRDITEQKKAEESLRQSEERFRSVTQSANDAIISVDSKGRIFGWNRGAEIAFGFTENEILGQSLNLIIPEDYIAKHVKAMVRLEMRGEKYAIGKTVELYGKKKNGDTFPLELSLSDWKTAEGMFFTGIIRDITKRKRTELENQIIYEITHGISTTSNIDELLKLIHNSLGKAVYAENFFVALNNERTGLFSFPYFVDKFDETPSPMSMGKSCSSYVFRTVKPFLYLEEEFQHLVNLNEVELVGTASPSWVGIPLQTPSKVLGVMVLQHYEKENVFSEDDVKFLTSVGGQIAFAIERKLAESALQESERDLNESQKIAGLGSYNLDFNTGRWTSSKILDSIFGIDEEYERSVNGWSELIHPEWQEIMNNYLQNEVILNKALFDKEYKIIRKNDSAERWVHGRGELLFDKEGNLLSMIGNILDITQRKEAEDEIRLKNELLQTINSEKDRFFSILAHDLRGPLSAFVAATEIITEEIQIMTIDEIKDITLSMKTSATGIYSLLENLLEWSRLQRGVMDFIPEKINLKNKIIDCTNVLTESAHKKNIAIEISVDDKMFVFADKHMFDTIVRNLISNALKFTNSGGKVTITAAFENQKSIMVNISDSGIGMTPELIQKLFKINEKSSRPGTSGEPSTGLGLLLCKEFVEKNGGVIKVTSEVNVGSTFTFTIPDIDA